MCRPYKKWRTEEIKALVKSIQKNPSNLQQCFREHASRYNRTLISVHAYWYKFLNNPQSTKYVGTCFTLISHNREYTNGKIYIPDYCTKTPVPILKRVWNKVMSALRDI